MIPIHGSTRLFAVVGHPTSHSLSPAMYNAAFSALGLEAMYLAIDVEASGLPDLMRGFQAGRIGGNVTVPHKVAAANLVVRKTDLAAELQAVNTFWPEDDGLVGDNTDVSGVIDVLDSLGATGPWLVAGTGGSARAVAAAARSASVPVLVQSRNSKRAADFVAWARGLGADAHQDDGRQLGAAINATPLGLKPQDAMPIALERLDGCRVALDLVYGPGETEWCLASRAQQIRAADGRAVLIAQGIRAFSRFFPNITPPHEIMRATVDRALRV